MKEQKIFITGVAGFIGFHLAKRLLNEGHFIIGLDIVNDYYDPKLKYSRLAQLERFPNFSFNKIDLIDRDAVLEIFSKEKPDFAINLAAQAGVRYARTHPHAYIDSNVTGFLNILEACRHTPVKHLVYASSSSVYGANTKLPFSTEDNVDHPLSLYAATKKANELMAHTYSHLYGVPTTGLRFFTVYGPWGRPDMALFMFTKAILAGEPITVFNHGEMMRDFTYVDDIVEGIVRVTNHPPEATKSVEALNPACSHAPYRLYNIGNSNSVKLMDFIYAIEKELGKKAIIQYEEMQPDDVKATYSDISDLTKATGYQPKTNVEEGIHHFIKWYRDYYGA
jgi:UDP-glucuronate 4-epimerase